MGSACADDTAGGGGDGAGSGGPASSSNGSTATSGNTPDSDTAASAESVDAGTTASADSPSSDASSEGLTGTTLADSATETGDSSGTGRAGDCDASEDGCCTGLALGQPDPDCEPLSCDQLVLSAPILFQDHLAPYNRRRGGVGLAWTGTELHTMRLDVQDDTALSNFDRIHERRAWDGTLLEESVIGSCSNVSCRGDGPTSLTYHHQAQRWMFVSPNSGLNTAFVFDESGELWSTTLGESCNPVRSNVEVTAFHDGFAVGMDADPCSGPNEIQHRRYDLGGDVTALVPIPEPAHTAGFSCGAGCDELVSVYSFAGGAGIGATVLDPVTDQVNDVTLAGILYGGVDYMEVVFNGTNYFVVDNEFPTAGSGYRMTTGFFQPGSGWTAPRMAIGSGHRGHHPAVVWTGDGYIMAVTTFDENEIYATPGARTNYAIEIVSFAADGSVRERFALEPHAGLNPELVYIGGRVAISWVRVALPANSSPEERYLSFLSCP